jgi:hypothetical protein
LAELFADVEVSNSAEFIYKSRETTAQDFKLISDPREFGRPNRYQYRRR